MADRFTVVPFDSGDKYIEIRDSKHVLTVWIDYDDVDHPKVREELPALLAKLNELS